MEQQQAAKGETHTDTEHLYTHRDQYGPVTTYHNWQLINSRGQRSAATAASQATVYIVGALGSPANHVARVDSKEAMWGIACEGEEGMLILGEESCHRDQGRKRTHLFSDAEKKK
ncbi:uncharacterized protein A4U43_C01F24210 [Asparagus officinalis]|uniref:Uncharacterized protein n=1 Tax=Asparagus officinalis TaxID=4686 RepID=A0A5P1FSL0_ASPOF|nr:uncharacterized protein A4U43_C01F24210 [Asparagus officinalis]